MDSMMSMVHAQINRAIILAISDRVIPEIRKIVSSTSSSGNRDTEASSSPNSQENRERMTGLKTRITKKDSMSACDLRDTEDLGPYNPITSSRVLNSYHITSPLCILLRQFETTFHMFKNILYDRKWIHALDK